MNPFLSEYTTPHGVPPFDQVQFEHFEPAFKAGFAEQVAEYEAIEQNAEAPTFENTIGALERSGAVLSRVARVFYSLLGTDSTDELSALAKDVGAQMASHRNRLYLSQAIFDRIHALHENPSEDWTEEQHRLVAEIYRKFARSGVQLRPFMEQAGCVVLQFFVVSCICANVRTRRLFPGSSSLRRAQMWWSK